MSSNLMGPRRFTGICFESIKITFDMPPSSDEDAGANPGVKDSVPTNTIKSDQQKEGVQTPSMMELTFALKHNMLGLLPF
jgi:hypothetical protein